MTCGLPIYRLSLRGNRRINHALHMAAITQIRHAHSDGRAYYERKIAEGKTRKEALRCLKRRISDAVFARLHADARKATATAAAKGPGGQPLSRDLSVTTSIAACLSVRSGFLPVSGGLTGPGGPEWRGAIHDGRRLPAPLGRPRPR